MYIIKANLTFVPDAADNVHEKFHVMWRNFRLYRNIVYFIWTNVSFGGIFLDLGGKIVNFMWTIIESQIFLWNLFTTMRYLIDTIHLSCLRLLIVFLAYFLVSPIVLYSSEIFVN